MAISFYVAVVAVCLGGCAQTPVEPADRTVQAIAPARAHSYEEKPSAALAFVPPIAAYAPALDLSRDGRAPEAFVGFDTLSTSFFYDRTDDRQTNDNSGHYLRRTVIERVGVSYR